MRHIIFNPQPEALAALEIPESDSITLLPASLEEIYKSGLLDTGESYCSAREQLCHYGRRYR